MGILEELRAAVGSVTGFRGAAAALPRHVQTAGLAWYPALGLGLGALAAGVAAAVGSVFPALAGAAGILVLEAPAGPRARRALSAAAGLPFVSRDRQAALDRLRGRPGALGVAVGLVALGAKLWAASALAPPARTAGLLLAPLLGRWAIVVQCYGGAPGLARGPAAALVGRARFREFAAASLVAFAVTLALAEAVGLVVLLLAALVTLGVRVVAHRRLGGLTGRMLAATCELVETSVLVLLAVLARR